MRSAVRDHSSIAFLRSAVCLSSHGISGQDQPPRRFNHDLRCWARFSRITFVASALGLSGLCAGWSFGAPVELPVDSTSTSPVEKNVKQTPAASDKVAEIEPLLESQRVRLQKIVGANKPADVWMGRVIVPAGIRGVQGLKVRGIGIRRDVPEVDKQFVGLDSLSVAWQSDQADSDIVITLVFADSEPVRWGSFVLTLELAYANPDNPDLPKTSLAKVRCEVPPYTLKTPTSHIIQNRTRFGVLIDLGLRRESHITLGGKLPLIAEGPKPTADPDAHVENLDWSDESISRGGFDAKFILKACGDQPSLRFTLDGGSGPGVQTADVVLDSPYGPSKTISVSVQTRDELWTLLVPLLAGILASIALRIVVVRIRLSVGFEREKARLKRSIEEVASSRADLKECEAFKSIEDRANNLERPDGVSPSDSEAGQKMIADVVELKQQLEGVLEEFEERRDAVAKSARELEAVLDAFPDLPDWLGVYPSESDPSGEIPSAEQIREHVADGELEVAEQKINSRRRGLAEHFRERARDRWSDIARTLLVERPGWLGTGLADSILVAWYEHVKALEGDRIADSNEATPLHAALQAATRVDEPVVTRISATVTDVARFMNALRDEFLRFERSDDASAVQRLPRLPEPSTIARTLESAGPDGLKSLLEEAVGTSIHAACNIVQRAVGEEIDFRDWEDHGGLVAIVRKTFTPVSEGEMGADGVPSAEPHDAPFPTIAVETNSWPKVCAVVEASHIDSRLAFLLENPVWRRRISFAVRFWECVIILGMSVLLAVAIFGDGYTGSLTDWSKLLAWGLGVNLTAEGLFATLARRS